MSKAEGREEEENGKKKALAQKFIQPNVVVAFDGNLMHQLPLLPSVAFDTNCRCSHFRHFI